MRSPKSLEMLPVELIVLTVLLFCASIGMKFNGIQYYYHLEEWKGDHFVISFYVADFPNDHRYNHVTS